jgi:chromosome segregation ATPase
MALMNTGSSDLSAMLKVLSDPVAMAARLEALQTAEVNNVESLKKVQEAQAKLNADTIAVNKVYKAIEKKEADIDKKTEELAEQVVGLRIGKEKLAEDQKALVAKEAEYEEKYKRLEQASRDMALRDADRQKELDRKGYALNDQKNELIVAELAAKAKEDAAAELIEEYKEKLAVLKSLV